MPSDKTPNRSAGNTEHGLSLMMEQIIRNAHSVAHVVPALEIASYRAGRT